MLKFNQKKPHPALANYIRGYWLIESGSTTELLDLVPDGYPEIFITLNESVQAFLGATQSVYSPKMGLIGQVTGRFAFEAKAFSKVLYIKLYPWTPYALFKIPAWELNNTTVSMEALTRDPAFQTLENEICAAENFEQQAAVLDTFFMKKLAGCTVENPFLHFAVRQIFTTNGTARVDDLTTYIHASRRYVEKLFKQEIGMSPKQYAQIIRVKKASMYMLDNRFTGNLNTIAGSLNYYDQSHFLKDFKAVVRLTPTAFLQQQLNFSEDNLRTYLGQWDYS